VHITVRNPLAKPALLTFLDILFGIPMTLPFIVGYFDAAFTFSSFFSLKRS
jgi:hypothetical protein